MTIKRLIVTLGVVLYTSFSFAQDLVRKIPKDASLVATFNNKAFFDFLNVDTINAKLIKTKFFDELLDAKNIDGNVGIEDFGIDLSSKAYLYIKGADSIQFVGGLIPLANKSQFEAFIKNKNRIEYVNNLPSIYSADRTVRMSWDDHTLYILTGLSIGDFFDRQEVKERYGLLGYYDEAVDSSWDWDAVAADSVYVEGYDEEWTVPDTTVVAQEEYLYGEEEEDEYAIVDSILGQEAYADDYYTRYDSIYRYNDSIKNKLINEWVNIEFADIVNGKAGSYDTKHMKPLSKNTIFNVHVGNMGTLYGNFFPQKMFMQSLGMPWYLMGNEVNGQDPSLESYYGMQAYDGQVDVIGNKLKITGGLVFDKKVAQQYNSIYRRGVNPKFYNFLHKDILGFMSVNINTEAYLKQLPKLIEQYYGPLVPGYADYISLGATLFDVIVDEKAVGKVFKGDNLFVLNGVTNTTVTYTDYEYDDEYNAIEVEKTKVETIPQFMYMFSSEDTRIFDVLVKLGVNKEELVAHDGFYEIKKLNNKSGIVIYIQNKNGVIYVGNDLEAMTAIQENTMRQKGHPAYIALAKKNAVALLFNPRRVPVLLEELEVPIKSAMLPIMNDLKQYGDVYFATPGMVGNTFKTESVVEFPKTKPNALLFLLDVIERLSVN